MPEERLEDGDILASRDERVKGIIDNPDRIDQEFGLLDVSSRSFLSVSRGIDQLE
jgi:hypothetical protein